MKKIRLAMAFSLCLALVQPVSALAYVSEARNPSEAGKSEAALNGYSEEEWAGLMDNTLEYGEIDDLVKNFNVNISTAWSKFNENIDNLNASIDTFKAAKRNIESMESSAKDSGDIENMMLYAAQGKGIAASIQAMSISRDKLSREITSSNAAVRNAQSQVSDGVRSLMIGYRNVLAQEEMLKTSVSLYESELGTANQSLSLGVSTGTDVTKSVSDLSNARANLAELTANKEKLYRTLITMCGWQPDASVVIGEVPEVSEEELAALNPSSDVKTAIGNNSTLITNRNNSSSKSSTSIDAKLYQSDQDEAMLLANLNQMYDKIVSDRTALAAAKAGNGSAAITENALETQRQMGMLSTAGYLGGKLSVLKKRAELTGASLQLRTDYNAYIQALNGNASIE